MVCVRVIFGSVYIFILFWGRFNETINYSTRACWIWDDNSWVSATDFLGYLPSHIQRLLVKYRAWMSVLGFYMSIKKCFSNPHVATKHGENVFQISCYFMFSVKSNRACWRFLKLRFEKQRLTRPYKNPDSLESLSCTCPWVLIPVKG